MNYPYCSNCRKILEDCGCDAPHPPYYPESSRDGRKITLYRDDSTVQVVYENVKTFFWTAGNTVLVISQYTSPSGREHHYIHWPRERFCWFKDHT